MEPSVSFSGVDALIIVNAAMTMQKPIFNSLMRHFLEDYKKPGEKVEKKGFRILLSSDWLDDLSYVRLIENLGASVAMDDLNTGSRYFFNKVKSNGDPIANLAERYLTKLACPRMGFWKEQIDQIRQWVSQYSINGVINFPEIYCWPRRLYECCLKDSLSKDNIPITTVKREYHFSNAGQLETRIQAFLETLEK
jgi:benzoyl-CoA reductase/2-hydroxyglutaryl-CoA dehydratase subunit BcrC/BadD/HgdB